MRVNSINSAERLGLQLYDPDMVMKARPRAGGPDQAAAAAERQVLAQERALKASVPGGTTHTTYTYAIGPDGRQYITGANVSVIAPEDELKSATGGTGRPAGTRMRTKSPAEADDASPRAAASKTEDPRVKRQIEKLQQRQNEVIAHEAAHMAAGGSFAGAASYTYTTGPDGKRYITGGSVPISTPATSDPREALENALRVLSAATAPGSPSGQDMAVAANAAQTAAQARIDMAASEGAETGEAATVGGDDPEALQRLTASQARGAYEASRSPKGMWTRTGGFDPATLQPVGPNDEEDSAPFEMAI